VKTTSKTGRHQLMLAVALGALAGVGVSTARADAAIGTSQSQNSANPSGLGDLLRQARQAMAQGHPNVAIIYLKNAAALAPKNTSVRVELGVAYLRSGDSTSAVRELRAARQAGAPNAQVLPFLYDALLAHNEGQALLDQFPAPNAGDRSPLAAATLRARGMAQVQTAHLDQAVASLDQALAISRDAPSLVLRARLAKDQKDLPLALKFSEEAYSKAPSDPNVLLLRISLFQMVNKADQALGAANTLVKVQPGNPVSLLSRAGVYIQLQQDAKARVDIDAVLNQWKGLPQALYYKALLLERAKDAKGAWDIAQALPPEFIASRPEIGVLTSQMATAAGHTDVAITILAGTVSRYPDAIEPRVILGSQYLRMNNAQRALDTLLPASDSQEPRAMLLIGQAYAMQKQYAKSTEYFEKANSSGFGGDLLKRQLAASNMQKGDYEAAIKQLRELNAKQPSDQVTAGLLLTALVRSNDITGAGTVADKLAAAAPKSPYGPLYQGQILIAKQDFKGAEAAFTRSISLDPKFVLALYDRAVARAGSGNLPGANADFQSVLTIDPKNVMAMIRSAEIWIRMGQEQKAQETLQRAVATDPKNSAPNLALSSFYISRNKMKEASAAVGAYLKLAPNDVNGQMVQAEIQMATGQIEPALATFRRLAAQRPDSPQIQLMLAAAFGAKKDTKSALAAYQRAVQLAPKFALARSSLVRYALGTSNTDIALTAAMDGTKQDPGTASDILLASTLMTLKKPDQAQSVLKQGLAQHPNEAGTIFYSQLLRQANKAKQADQVLVDWTAKHPNDVGPRLEIAQQQMQSDPAAAEQQFRAVLKVQPNNMVALNNLSWLLQKKDTKQAISYAEQAAKQAPNSAPILDTLGWVKWQGKDASGALPVLQKAHASDPNNAEIAYHLAVVLDANGRRAEAKKTLAAVLASNQEFSEKREAEALNVRLR
jgi:putative PEP-CTERM system TPR-repeat lipoprotein